VNFKSFIFLSLIPAFVLAQTPVPTPPTHRSKKPYHAKIFLQKKSITSQSAALPAVPPSLKNSLPFELRGTSRSPETQARPMDTNDYQRLNSFFMSNYSMGKTSNPSGDGFWGLAGTMASGVCAGIAAAQWLEAQGKNNQKTEPKPSSGIPKTKSLNS